MYVVSCKEFCDFLYSNTNKNSFAFVCFIHTCVVCLVVVHLPSWYIYLQTLIFFYHLHSLISQISDCVSDSQTFVKLTLSFTPIIMQRSTLITFYSVWENRSVKDFDTSIIKDQRHLITRVNNFLTLLKNFANCNSYTLLTSSCRASLISRL